jgi:hypothetical protein
MSAETGDRASTIAGEFINMTPEMLAALTATDELTQITAKKIRSLAASALRQDETKGFRKLIKKMIG